MTPYLTAGNNTGKVLSALLLCIQLFCVIASAFAVEPQPGGADIHHPGYTLSSDTDADAADKAPFADNHPHGCDHCSHCHASHMGLFKSASSLPVSSEVQPNCYLSYLPSSPKPGIYRPPIA